MLVASFASPAAAEWYVAPFISAGRANIENSDHHGTIGTGSAIDGEVDGALRETTMRDSVAGIGVSVGRGFGNWNADLELTWRYRTDWDLAAATPSIDSVTNVFTNVQTTTVMANVGREFALGDHWTLQGGAGLGFAYYDLNSDYIEREAPGVRERMQFADRSEYAEPCWNIFVDVSRPIGKRWSANVRYRFIDLGGLETGPYPGRDARLTADHTSHELLFRFVYR